MDNTFCQDMSATDGSRVTDRQFNRAPDSWIFGGDGLLRVVVAGCARAPTPGGRARSGSRGRR